MNVSLHATLLCFHNLQNLIVSEQCDLNHHFMKMQLGYLIFAIDLRTYSLVFIKFGLWFIFFLYLRTLYRTVIMQWSYNLSASLANIWQLRFGRGQVVTIAALYKCNMPSVPKISGGLIVNENDPSIYSWLIHKSCVLFICKFAAARWSHYDRMLSPPGSFLARSSPESRVNKSLHHAWKHSVCIDMGFYIFIWLSMGLCLYC